MAHRLATAICANLAVLDFDGFLRRESKNKSMGLLRDLSNDP